MSDQWRISSKSGTGCGEGTKAVVVNDDTREIREVIVSANNDDKAAENKAIGEKIAEGAFYK